MKNCCSENKGTDQLCNCFPMYNKYTSQGHHRIAMQDHSNHIGRNINHKLGLVVQNFVSLTLSLSPQFVNYISTSKANTLIFC